MVSVTKNQGRAESGPASQATEPEVTLGTEVGVRRVEPVEGIPNPVGQAARFLVGLVGLFVVFAVTWGAAWASLPALIPGWTSAVITSGSMAPAIGTGDVVVAEPSDGTSLDVGTVVMFEDPSRSGYLTHRIVGINEDGTYQTQGDANPVADSTPLRPEQVVGTGRFLIPAIGLPFLWIASGAWVKVASMAVFLLIAFWLVRFALINPYDLSTRYAEPPHGSG